MRQVSNNNKLVCRSKGPLLLGAWLLWIGLQVHHYQGEDNPKKTHKMHTQNAPNWSLDPCSKYVLFTSRLVSSMAQSPIFLPFNVWIQRDHNQIPCSQLPLSFFFYVLYFCSSMSEYKETISTYHVHSCHWI